MCTMSDLPGKQSLLIRCISIEQSCIWLKTISLEVYAYLIVYEITGSPQKKGLMVRNPPQVWDTPLSSTLPEQCGSQGGQGQARGERGKLPWKGCYQQFLCWVRMLCDKAPRDHEGHTHGSPPQPDQHRITSLKSWEKTCLALFWRNQTTKRDLKNESFELLVWMLHYWVTS